MYMKWSFRDVPPSLWSSAALVDYGFVAYAVRGEGLSGEMDDIFTYIVVTCDDDTYVDAADCVLHNKGLQETV